MLIRNYNESKKFKLFREMSELYNPHVGSWTYDVWQTLNQKCFNGELKVGPIEWGLTSHGRAAGYFTEEINKITLHKSLLKPHSTAWNCFGLLGERLTEGVILHEMVHQKIYQKLGVTRFEKGECHNFQPWCDEVNRINLLLGFEGRASIIKPQKVRELGARSKVVIKMVPVEEGALTLKQLTNWPHSLKLVDYYRESPNELIKKITDDW